MNANSLEVGVTYFRIAYADVDQTMPSVEPIVFAGVDIFGASKDGLSKYYFQDTTSVLRFGLGRGIEKSEVKSPLDTSDACGDTTFFAHQEDEIGQVILDICALGDEIGVAIAKAKKLHFPKLTQAKGKWL
ncbi:hypothetical protein OU995_23205 [Roseateles sp. SL47]|uniref:hypothetical protein n=1 Tax=Roseateles sp. SL47 TaxID=2995138 RepID=UPI002270613F|nr:hypothetical protein [Roseateles sp. SL47]WAC72429.1 hypothetical protein OU995_23205 [Roseateles sp. SL47]